MVSIREIMRGYSPGKIQRVGNMAVVPITTDIPFTEVGNTTDVYMSCDKDYQTMEFTNESKHVSIVPQGYMIMQTKVAAQDRAVPAVELIKGKGKRDVNVKCVESTQGGHFRDQSDDRDWQFLPLSLRASAMGRDNTRSQSYSTLWSAVEQYNQWAGTGSGSHIATFYKHYEKDLDTFVAQFELVDGQIGAMVFINDQLRAIEIMPNVAIWGQNFHRLIRYSYGADALAAQKDVADDLHYPRLENGNGKIKTLDQLAEGVDHMIESDRRFVSESYGAVADIEFPDNITSQVGALSMIDMGTKDGFTAQAVLHGNEHFVYASIISKHDYKRKVLRARSLDNSPYSAADFKF